MVWLMMKLLLWLCCVCLTSLAAAGWVSTSINLPPTVEVGLVWICRAAVPVVLTYASHRWWTMAGWSRISMTTVSSPMVRCPTDITAVVSVWWSVISLCWDLLIPFFPLGCLVLSCGQGLEHGQHSGIFLIFFLTFCLLILLFLLILSALQHARRACGAPPVELHWCKCRIGEQLLR